MTGHDVTEADKLYKQNMNDVRDLLRNLDGKVKRQRDLKAKIRTTHEQIAQSYQQIEDTVKEKAAKMIESIKKQEEDILRILHQKRDQELEPLLEKLDSVEWHLENAQRVNKDVQTVDQFDKLAKQNTLLQELRELDKSDVTTYSCDRTRQVKFVAGQTEPVVGRLEVVKRRTDDTSGCI
ncbi:hypothetical protein NP493_661g00000 [Ridgeia piscesae]|uniref:Uncharacterized protein n=1 Tax=Ridgeia piscesae TaxID=27915 RepID=A0AAD9KRR2_RIDPI|nr:hypothetical protein NP493_661g00000 [Ridgeia piscesae]